MVFLSDLDFLSSPREHAEKFHKTKPLDVQGLIEREDRVTYSPVWIIPAPECGLFPASPSFSHPRPRVSFRHHSPHWRLHRPETE
ncbi:hypothetical protein J6590_031062 [Homalodisca vitripennis]|nr:hypothetical protein J6590_031062 [Homalodisca vitripennis]